VLPPERPGRACGRQRCLDGPDQFVSTSELPELTVEKQASILLRSAAARRHVNESPDELWTKVSIEFYRDAADAAFKALEN
jgi:ATP-dependent Lon protease